MNLPIIKLSKVWYTLSALLLAASIGALATWGLNLGIDFTGGSLMAVEFTQGRPDASAIKDALASFDLGEISQQSAGERDMNIRFKQVDEAVHKNITATLAEKFPGAEERRFESIGGTIGSELKTRSARAVLVVLVLILVFLAWSFRKVSLPVASWKYGVAAIVALFHDIIITLGVFSVLGHFLRDVEINASFIAALLTVLSYSVADTIVVFDRTRENLVKMRGTTFADIVNTSVNQTIQRSINTSLTIILSLVAIVLYGGESIRYFALALIIGIGFGTYSSIFIASPVLCTWEKLRRS